MGIINSLATKIAGRSARRGLGATGRSLMSGGGGFAMSSLGAGMVGGVAGGIVGYADSPWESPNLQVNDAISGAVGGAILGFGGINALRLGKYGAKKVAAKYSDNAFVKAGGSFLELRQALKTGDEGLISQARANYEGAMSGLKEMGQKKIDKFSRKAAQGVDLSAALFPGGVARLKQNSAAAFKQSRQIEKEAFNLLKSGDQAGYDMAVNTATTVASQGKKLENEFLRLKGTDAGRQQWKAYKKYGSVGNFLNQELPTTGAAGLASSIIRTGVNNPLRLGVGMVGVGMAASIAYTPSTMIMNETSAMISQPGGGGSYGNTALAQSTDGLVFGLHNSRH